MQWSWLGDFSNTIQAAQCATKLESMRFKIGMQITGRQTSAGLDVPHDVVKIKSTNEVKFSRSKNNDFPMSMPTIMKNLEFSRPKNATSKTIIDVKIEPYSWPRLPRRHPETKSQREQHSLCVDCLCLGRKVPNREV